MSYEQGFSVEIEVVKRTEIFGEVDDKIEAKVLHRTKVGYYESGRYRRRGQLQGWQRNGRFRTYDERENVTDEDIYEDGECVEVCEGDA